MAAIVTAVALSAAVASAAAVAMTHSVQSANTLNTLSEEVAQVLDTQKNLDAR